jgi:hypothetical protein
MGATNLRILVASRIYPDACDLKFAHPVRHSDCSRRSISIQNVVTQRQPILLFRLKTECARIVGTARGGLVPNPILPVALMIVKEASYPSLERCCLLQITDATGAVEELPLRGNSIPAHKHGRAQTLQNLLFFLGKGGTVVVILSPLNRFINMDRHPFFVFSKPRVGLLEIAEFLRFLRRTRCVGE